MHIYQHEIKDGLEEKIHSFCKADTECVAIPNDLAKAADLFKSEQLEGQKHNLSHDLACIYGIMVTTNWNRNDDIFTPKETAPYVSSPIMKPADINHNAREVDKKQEIVGVISDSRSVDDSYTWIDPFISDKYHILVTILLWEQYFPSKVTKIKEGIDKGTLFLSMECLFKDFGYGLRKKGDTVVSLLPRNEATSWLTKHLRVYGGSGVVKINGSEYQVGRWIKDPLFSGVAFVDKPGNLESIIFQDYLSHSATAAYIPEGDLKNFEENVVTSHVEGVLEINEGNIALWPIK